MTWLTVCGRSLTGSSVQDQEALWHTYRHVKQQFPCLYDQTTLPMISWKYHFCVQKHYCFIPIGQRLPSNSPMRVDVIIHFHSLRMPLDYYTLQTVPSQSSQNHYTCNPLNHTSPISLTVLGAFVSLLISVNPELKSHVIWSEAHSPSNRDYLSSRKLKQICLFSTTIGIYIDITLHYCTFLFNYMNEKLSKQTKSVILKGIWCNCEPHLATMIKDKKGKCDFKHGSFLCRKTHLDSTNVERFHNDFKCDENSFSYYSAIRTFSKGWVRKSCVQFKSRYALTMLSLASDA
jgi:hypothetical protein